MNIQYFEFGNYGWGQIFRHQISTEDENYISHTDNSVTFADSYTDFYGETQDTERTLPRKFSMLRDQLITDHKRKIAELQKDVDVLEASDSFEIYEVNEINARQTNKVGMTERLMSLETIHCYTSKIKL